MVQSFLMMSILPWIEAFGVALLLWRLTGGRVRQVWLQIAGLETTVLVVAMASCSIAQSLSPVTVDKFEKDGSLYVIPYHSVQFYFIALFGLAFVACAILLAILRWQTGERPKGIGLIASALLCAELAFGVKFWASGWFILTEIFTGIAVAAPVIHVLLRIAISDAPRNAGLVLTSLGSDLVLIAATLFRYDAPDGPAFVVFQTIIGPASGPLVPSWMQWVTSGNGELYDFALYVPVVLSWIALAMISERARSRVAPATPAR